MGFYEQDMRPSLADDPGWSKVGVEKEVRLKETVVPAPPDMTSQFDDTFSASFYMTQADQLLREANSPYFEQNNPASTAGAAQSSSKNYPLSAVKIIDGEHKTLLGIGEMAEAMDDDPDDYHLTEHRMMFANPHLNEAQMKTLLKHMESHVKSKKHKLKAAREVEDAKHAPHAVGARFRKGLGFASKALPSTTTDVIPQDSAQSAERKRTAGNISMESKLRKFHAAIRRSYGQRRSL